MDSIEKINIQKGREVVYAILSDIFLFPPNKEIFDKAHALIKFLDNSDENENNMLTDGLVKLKEFINTKDISLEERQSIERNTALAYTTLYCLGSAVPISESVYVSPVHLEMQENEIKVSYIYKANHFSMNHTSNEPSDHISYELMFMSFLSKNLAAAIQNNDYDKVNHIIKVQLDFLDQHLINFATLFTKQTIYTQVDLRFYGPVSYILLGFIKADYEYLKSILDK